MWLHLVATENRLGHSEPEGETEPCLLSNLSCVGWVGFSVLGVRPLHFLKWFSSAKKRCENVSTDIKSQEQDVAVVLKKGAFCGLRLMSAFWYRSFNRFFRVKSAFYENSRFTAKTVTNCLFSLVFRKCTIDYESSICIAEQITEEVESERLTPAEIDSPF